MEIPGLEEASRLLGGAVLGPRELTAALGFDPLAVLPEDERPAVARIPFGAADLERARAEGEVLVLRLARDPAGPFTMLRLAARLDGGLDPKVHKGVGYLLRDEWTIDEQPFAAAPAERRGDRLRYSLLASRARRAPAGPGLGLVAERDRRPWLRCARRVRP